MEPLEARVLRTRPPKMSPYGYDDAFRITGITDTVNAANSWTYGYDTVDRLTSAVKTGLTQGWTYDLNGNRLTQTGSTPSTYTVSTTSNRVSSSSGSLARTYAYDAAGNTTGYAGISFTYNQRGRMSSASNGGNSATYLYNALGQRVKRVGPAGTTLYMYDEAGHLIGEYDGSGAMIQETVWLGDIPVATLRPKTGGIDIYYVHTDHLNTPRLVTQPSNNAARWRWDSDPFGTTVPNENPQALGTFQYNLRFPGQLYDSLAGLNYNYFRDYDPAVGKYVQSDPIGLKGGVNTYGYVDNNPVMRIDPSGRSWVVVIVTVAGAAATLWIANDIICKCEKAHPKYRSLESTDRNAFFRCIGALGPFMRLLGVATDPIGGSAAEIGGIVGEHMYDACEK